MSPCCLPVFTAHPHGSPQSIASASHWPTGRLCDAAAAARVRRCRQRTVAAAGGDAGDGSLLEDFSRAAAAQQALRDYERLMLQHGDDDDDALDLLEGATLIARHRYPLLTLGSVEEQLDDLAVQVEGRLPGGSGGGGPPLYPLKILQAISAVFAERGFRGNTDDYYAPDNSCINRVLDTRLGIPITLGLVYVQVAQRLGLPMVGVNLPGHFFVAPADPDLQFLVDAFHGGDITFREDAEATLAAIYRSPVQLDPAVITSRRPLPPRTFLARMLNNLKQVYRLRGQHSEAYTICCYLRATRPGDLRELRDAGVCLYQAKRFSESVELLSEFVALAPEEDAEDVQKVRALLRGLRQQGDGGGGGGDVA